jgi:hypothetical protein
VLPIQFPRNVGPEFEQDRADTAFGRYDHRALERKPNATVAGWIVGIGNSSGCQSCPLDKKNSAASGRYLLCIGRLIRPRELTAL